MSKVFMKRYTVRIFINFFVFLIIGFYVFYHKNDFSILLNIKWDSIVLLLGVMLLNFWLRAMQFASLNRGLGTRMSAWESIGISSIASMASLLLPHATFITKAAILKQKYALPYSKTPVIFLGNVILFLVVGSLVMAISIVFAYFIPMPVPLIVWFCILIGIASFFLLFIGIPEKFSSHFGRIGRWLILFSQGWLDLRNNKRCLFEASIYQLLIFATGGLNIAISYRVLGLEINLIFAVMIAVVTSFSNLLVLTPGNLGIQEGLYGYLSQLFGLNFVQGVAASFLIRAVGIIIILGVFPFAWYSLLRKQKDGLSQSNVKGPIC